MRSLFGRSNLRTLIEFPSHLSSFVSNIGSRNLEIQSLIRQHTLLPIHAPFVTSESLQKIEKGMRQNGHTGALHLAGAMSIGFKNPEQLRFCPNCATEERTRTGEAHWHRLHQIAGVMVCPIHEVFLQESNVRPREGMALHLAETSIVVSEAEKLNASDPSHIVFRQLAEDALWLLQNWTSDKVDLLYRRYILLATKRGYVGPRGSLIWKRILPDFQARYSPETLSALQCSIPMKAFAFRQFWLSHLLRSSDCIQPPIRHLLLMNFLGCTAQQILSTSEDTAVWRGEMRECGNPICPKAGQKGVEFNYRPKDQGRLRALHATCTECGRVSYWCKIRGVETERVETFGPVWDAELERLWGDVSLSLLKIAKALNINRASLKTQAARLGLAFPRQGGGYKSELRKVQRVVDRDAEKELRRTERRVQWEALRNAKPLASRSELQKLAPSCHGWLYENDFAWLNENSPMRKVPPSPWQKGKGTQSSDAT
jgi:hypothetical protein